MIMTEPDLSTNQFVMTFEASGTVGQGTAPDPIVDAEEQS